MPFGLIGAVIGAGASLIGANKQKKANEAAQRAQNEYNERQSDPAEIRRKFEAAGFNPLLGVQGWQPAQQTGYVPSSIGSAISEAGAVFGNYFDGKAKEKSALTAAQQENAKLKERLRDQMLRPAVGGIFGGGDKPLKSNLTVKAGDDEDGIIGPLPPVNLWNPMLNQWVGMHPGTAKRLDVKDGDVILAEDYEAFGGEIIGEAMSMSDLANSIVRGGKNDHLLKPTVGGYVPKQSVRPSASSAPGYHRRETDFEKGRLNRPYLK